MATKSKSAETLRQENHELRLRLEEAEETLPALRSGEVDALMVGEQLFILETADVDSRRFRGDVLAQINEAVFATDGERRLVYINEAAERQYRVKADDVLGKPFDAMFTVRWPGENGREAALAEFARRAAGAGKVFTSGATGASSSPNRPQVFAAREMMRLLVSSRLSETSQTENMPTKS